MPVWKPDEVVIVLNASLPCVFVLIVHCSLLCLGKRPRGIIGWALLSPVNIPPPSCGRGSEGHSTSPHLLCNNVILTSPCLHL